MKEPGARRGGGTPEGGYIGAPIPRREDARLLTGRGTFVDDLEMPGVAHAAMVRSLHAHARVLRIDAEARPLFPFAHADDHSVVQAMVYRLDHGGPFILQPEEIVRGEWTTLAEVWRRAAAQSFCPDGLEVLRQMEAKYLSAG